VASKAPIATALAIVGATALAGCKSEKKPETTNLVLHANGPDWVNGGDGAFADERGKRFHGVGIVSGVRDAAVRRHMVDTRARAEVQKTLENFLDAIQKDVPMASDADADEKQRVQQGLKALAASDAGVRIVDHWVDTDSTEYALALIDLASFKDNLAKAKDLDGRTKDGVGRNADRVFDESSAERASHSARR
jgi:hypothetical protein